MENKDKILALVLSASLLAGCQMRPTTVAMNTAYNPKAAEINRQLTVAYLRQGDVDKAKAKLNAALAENPQSPAVYDTGAYFYSKTGNDVMAEQYFKQAIQLAPSTASYHNNYGVYLCQKKQYHAAVDQFLVAATDIRYTHPDTAYENAGLCSQQMQQPQQAVSYYQQALKINPKRPNALLQLAQISYDSQQFSQARAYLQQYQHVGQTTQQSKQLAANLATTVTHQQKVSS